jgi:predicted secreted hydrolase
MLMACSTALFSNQKQQVTVREIEFSSPDVQRDNRLPFEYANVARSFAFPIDHSAHTNYQIEWWYFTGNLTDETGRHFGYQLAIFRRGLLPGSVKIRTDSSWATTHLYSADFAVTDTGANEHAGFIRRSRGAAGLAGAEVAPFRVWVESWSITGPTADSPHHFTLRATEGSYAIDLQLEPSKPVVIHRPGGISPKNAEGTAASYYYSLTRLKTAGRVVTPSGTFTVTGQSWMDHEFGTDFLNVDASGWDWFAIQLDDGTDLALGRFRNKDNTYRLIYTGSLVISDGSHRTLESTDVTYEPLRVWRSPTSGYSYPVAWKIDVPSARLTLELTARVDDQEMQTTSIYWEGAVSIKGFRDGKPVSGSGYIEMTGAPLVP